MSWDDVLADLIAYAAQAELDLPALLVVMASEGAPRTEHDDDDAASAPEPDHYYPH